MDLGKSSVGPVLVYHLAPFVHSKWEAVESQQNTLTSVKINSHNDHMLNILHSIGALKLIESVSYLMMAMYIHERRKPSLIK